MFSKKVPDCCRSCSRFNILHVKDLVDVLQNALLDIGAGELIFGHFFYFFILFILLLIQSGSLFGKDG